jgi:hypothetical protein
MHCIGAGRKAQRKACNSLKGYEKKKLIENGTLNAYRSALRYSAGE